MKYLFPIKALRETFLSR